MIQKDSVRIPAWERENFRLYKGNIFPSRKSLVCDIPAGEGKTAKLIFTVYVQYSFLTCDGTIVSTVIYNIAVSCTTALGAKNSGNLHRQ
jgi:hypothetical protein